MNSNESALFDAVRKNNINKVNELINKDNLYINLVDKFNSTILMVAINSDNEELALNLIDRHADINKTNDVGSNALILAAARGQKKVVASLLDNHADINKVTIYNVSALTVAAANNHQEIVKYLINKGASTNETLKIVKTIPDREDIIRILNGNIITTETSTSPKITLTTKITSTKKVTFSPADTDPYRYYKKNQESTNSQAGIQTTKSTTTTARDITGSDIMTLANEYHGNRPPGSFVDLTNSYPSNGIEDTATLNPVIRDTFTISNLTHQIASDNTIYYILGGVTTVVISGAVVIGKFIYSKHKNNKNYNAVLADYSKSKNNQISSESILYNPC